jgi:hypothetical protein
VTVAQPAAIRRKVEAWLADDDDKTPAIALRAKPEWDGDAVLTIAAVSVRVVPCRTPLAARAALYDRVDQERLVLLTELTDAELGDGLLAHLSKQRVRNVDMWDVTANLFEVSEIDPMLARLGRWAAEALIDFAPPGGWPPPPGTVVTRSHALRCLAAELLGVDREQIDSAGLLQWTTEAARVLRLSKLPTPVITGLTSFLVDAAGAAAAPIMAAARAGHGVDAVPLGLLAGVLWPAPTGGPKATEVAVARTRLEPRFGGARLTDPEAAAFSAAAEAWVDRVIGSGDQAEGYRMLARAEAIAKEVDATALLGGSTLLPSGFLHRLRDLASAVRLAVPAAGGRANPSAIAAAQSALALVHEHRGGDRDRVETARMAVRLLRWLATTEPPAPATLYDALHRQVRYDGWVDRGRLDLFAGDTDPQVAEAYHLLHRAVDSRRARHDRQFAELLAAATQSESQPGALIRVEDVLENVVRPILDNGRRVLVLLMDGMSVAAATELAESVTRTGAWMELTPTGGPRVGVLAALPTVTEVSRCSLFSGRIAVGHQAEEITAFKQRFPSGQLLHKGDLRSHAGSAIAPDVVAALANSTTPLVAAVVNTIDDALDRSDPGTTVWGRETIRAVSDLLTLAQDRVLIIVSDHGHVIDRGPEGEYRSSAANTNRWRAADSPAGDGEVLVRGSRVAKGNGQVVLPWREEIRYGPRKAGYHGGASPAEAVIPLLIFSDGDEDAVPGWAGAPVASPDWWRESLPVNVEPAPVKRGRTTPRPTVQTESLFEVAAPDPAPVEKPEAGRPSLIEALLASDIYRQRRGTRAPLPDDRVAALLGALLAGGNRATMDTLAAHAGVPAHRINLTVTALRKLLQVEGYAVISIDPDGQTVKLDIALLTEQFHLDAP